MPLSAAIYMDYNATAPMRPEVAAAMAEAFAIGGNPSSVHRFGRVARRMIEVAREKVASALGTVAGQVVFTSGGTEANALAIHGAGRARVLVSAIEHESVLQALPQAEHIPVAADGRVDPQALDDLLSKDDRPALVAIMLANNETGVVQPVAELAAVAHAHKALFHCDAVQAVGRIGIDIAALGVDSLSVSAHKLGGPHGVGALVVAEGAKLAPLIRGGGQEQGRRAGTENVAGIVGFGIAIELASVDAGERSRIRTLRDDLETRVRDIAPEALIHGETAPRLANTACIGLPGASGEVQVIALDLAGIAVAAGAACSSGKARPSHVLAAMGLGEEQSRQAIRVSLGWRSRPSDIDGFMNAWGALRDRIRCESAAN